LYPKSPGAEHCITANRPATNILSTIMSIQQNEQIEGFYIVQASSINHKFIIIIYLHKMNNVNVKVTTAHVEDRDKHYVALTSNDCPEDIT